MTELLFKEEVFKIVGAAIEVHRELGSGFLEPVYQEALAIELASCLVPFEAQRALQILYKGHRLKKEYVPDFVCYQQLSGTEEAQALNYLKATNVRVALLLNFGGHGKLEWKRLVL